MIMTEDEARKHWCPFGTRIYASHPVNRTERDAPLTMCLASRCMAWQFYAPGPVNSALMQMSGVDPTLTRGMCGLVDRGGSR